MSFEGVSLIENKMLMISGAIDFQKSGNQTIKETVRYMLDEYDIDMLSFLPENYPNLDLNFENDFSNLKVRRIPFIFRLLFDCARFSKNIFRTKKKQDDEKYNKKKLSQFEDEVNYFDNYSSFGLFLYLVFQYVYFFLEFPRAVYYIKRNRPDVIYGYENNGALLASVLGNIFNIKVVKRFQGTPLKIKDGNIFQKGKMLQFTIPYAINKNKDLVVMANDGTRGDDILRNLGVPSENVYFPINGFVTKNLIGVERVDLKENFGFSQDTKVVVMLSKLKIWKRVDRGLYLLREILNRDKNAKVALIVIGDGEMRSELEYLAGKLGISGHVKFTGGLTHRESLEILNSCDSFWSFYDITNLGNPLLEACYLEKPIITLKCRDISALFSGRDLPSREEFDRIAEEAMLALYDDAKISELKGYSRAIKEKLVSWEDRIRDEIEFIRTH